LLQISLYPDKMWGVVQVSYIYPKYRTLVYLQDPVVEVFTTQYENPGKNSSFLVRFIVMGIIHERYPVIFLINFVHEDIMPDMQPP
jgi:hypothetical protein